MSTGFWYWFIYGIAALTIRIWHPILRVEGRENVPAGRCVICCNHSGMADPGWVILGMGVRYIPRIMAKKEALRIPVLGWMMQQIGVIPVDREGADVHAIKEGIRALRNDQQLMIFPEGTRSRPGKHIVPKRGALVLAHRTESPILPVYVSRKRRPFSPMTVILGKPYTLDFDGKPTDAQLEAATRELMQNIYEMGRGL